MAWPSRRGSRWCGCSSRESSLTRVRAVRRAHGATGARFITVAPDAEPAGARASHARHRHAPGAHARGAGHPEVPHAEAAGGGAAEVRARYACAQSRGTRARTPRTFRLQLHAAAAVPARCASRDVLVRCARFARVVARVACSGTRRARGDTCRMLWPLRALLARARPGPPAPPPPPARASAAGAALAPPPAPHASAAAARPAPSSAAPAARAPRAPLAAAPAPAPGGALQLLLAHTLTLCTACSSSVVTPGSPDSP